MALYASMLMHNIIKESVKEIDIAKRLLIAIVLKEFGKDFVPEVSFQILIGF